jgi:hypothetical protein
MYWRSWKKKERVFYWSTFILTGTLSEAWPNPGRSWNRGELKAMSAGYLISPRRARDASPLRSSRLKLEKGRLVNAADATQLGIL